MSPTDPTEGPSNHDLHQLFALSLDLICIANTSGYFEHTSPAFEETLGWDREELTEQPFVHFVHPDDIEATLAETAKLAIGEQSSHFENRYRCRDGSYRWLAWKARAIPEFGKIFAVARDVTWIKALSRQAEDREQLLTIVLNSASASLIVIDEHGEILLCNPATSEMFGYAREALIGCNVRMLMPQPHRDHHDTYIRSHLETGVSKVIGVGKELLASRQDGSTFPIHLNVSKFSLHDHPRFLGTIHDLTRTRARETHAQRLVARDAHQQGKSETSAAILHDIGNAITGIASRLERLSESLKDLSDIHLLSDAATFIRKHIADESGPISTERMLALAELLSNIATSQREMLQGYFGNILLIKRFVDHTLDLLEGHRRAGAGSGPRPRKISVRMLMLDAQNLIVDLARTAGIQSILHIDPELPSLFLEPSKITQVLLNLLKNAIEAVDELSSTISAPRQIILRAERYPEGIRLRVQDMGVGFEGDPERFFESGVTTKPRGSGLGLASARKVIEEELGGRIYLESSGPDEGTTATIELPWSCTDHVKTDP